MAKLTDPDLNKFIEEIERGVDHKTVFAGDIGEMDMSKKHDNPIGKFTTDGKGNETFYIDDKTNVDLRSNKPLDLVNHPPHYEGNIECIDAMQEVIGKTGVANFCVGNAFKYIWRCTKKHKSPIEDLKKAKWYIDKAIELIIDIEEDD